MSERTYLYGYGRRRHIASGEKGRQGGCPAFCGNWFHDEARTLQDYRQWLGEHGAQRRMAKLRALPVCKACERAAPPEVDPTDELRPTPATIELGDLLRDTLLRAQRVSSILCKQHGDGRWTWLWSRDDGSIGFEDVDPRLLPYLEEPT